MSIPSWFHDYSFVDIWWPIGISPLLHWCSNDYWQSKLEMKNNEDGGNREKKEKKLGISIWHYKIDFFNFLRFIAFLIFVAFKSFIRP